MLARQSPLHKPVETIHAEAGLQGTARIPVLAPKLWVFIPPSWDFPDTNVAVLELLQIFCSILILAPNRPLLHREHPGQTPPLTCAHYLSEFSSKSSGRKESEGPLDYTVAQSIGYIHHILKIRLFLFMYMNVLPTCMYTHHILDGIQILL